MATRTVIPNAIRLLFSSRDLESRTASLDKTFGKLNLKGMPEYQQAIDALEKYRQAAATRFEEEYQRRNA